MVHYDKEPPQMDFSIDVLNDKVSINLTSNEPLKRAILVTGNTTVKFKKVNDMYYSAVIDLPDAYKSGSPLPSSMLAV